MANLMNDKDSSDIPREFDFVVEDWVGRTEKLISKKEQAEKNNNPTSPTSNSPVSQPSPEYKSNLEAEIKRLQSQISELENKIKNTDNSSQKEAYRKILDNTKKGLVDKQKEKNELDDNKKNSESSNKSNVGEKKVYLVVVPVALVLGGIIGLLVARYFFKKQVEEWQKQMEKPDKEQVRNMLSALGRKPSEEQVNRFINMAKERQAKKKLAKTPKKKK
ncbi:10036_t:CDS:2 [Paraglomus occultum]|uniref:10036_t:CDS:1 n=1 Tax=Paraglomus occultum TaxID=144539 RepID=A0A9N9G6I4_9GLOM|nr:10036_t:CDS:2 [Paraglomus occultum]